MESRKQIIDRAEQVLEDPDNNIFSFSNISSQLPDCLNDISRYRPYEVIEERFTDASVDLDISDVPNLILVKKVEYPVDSTPRDFCNAILFGNTLTIDSDSTPSADDDINLYCTKNHILVDPPSSLAGIVDCTISLPVGTTSVVLKGLGTGVIKKDTIVTFVSKAGEYYVTADATITGNAATITITPGLLEVVLDDVVVAFKCSTLTPQLEGILPDLIAGKVAINGIGQGRTQIANAVSAVALVNSSTDSMTARLTQTATDIGSARTQITALLTDADASITAAGSAVTLALADFALANTSADTITTSLPMLVATTGAVDVALAKAITDIDISRTILATNTTKIASELALIDDEIDLAKDDLASARALNNTITVGSNPESQLHASAMGQLSEAQTLLAELRGLSGDGAELGSNSSLAGNDLNIAMGYLSKARAVISEYSSQGGEYIKVGAGELSAANTDINIARGIISQTVNAINSDLGVASREISLANSYLSQAGGYAREVASSISVANIVLSYQRWGQTKYQMAINDLKIISKPKVFRSY